MEQEEARYVPTVHQAHRESLSVDSLPRPEFLREHPPQTSRTYKIAQRIDDLTQVCFTPPPFSGSRGQERRYKCPFFVRQSTGVSFDSLREFLLPRAVFLSTYILVTIKAEVSKHALRLFITGLSDGAKWESLKRFLRLLLKIARIHLSL